MVSTVMKERNCNTSVSHLCLGCMKMAPTSFHWLHRLLNLENILSLEAKAVRTDTLVLSISIVVSNTAHSGGSFRTCLFPSAEWNTRWGWWGFLCSCTSAFAGWRSVCGGSSLQKARCKPSKQAAEEEKDFQAECTRCRKISEEWLEVKSSPSGSREGGLCHCPWCQQVACKWEPFWQSQVYSTLKAKLCQTGSCRGRSVLRKEIRCWVGPGEGLCRTSWRMGI